jgi:DNA-repair protein complementing XP-A cells
VKDYLLTDRAYPNERLQGQFLLIFLAELRDEELLPHMLKANPHHSTFSNMMLYLRMQVEEFAWKKWGSPEALDAEYEKRENEKKRKRGKKFEQSLKELRRRTKETVWQQRRDMEHQHTFGVAGVDDDGISRQTCSECGFEIEVEEL